MRYDVMQHMSHKLTFHITQDRPQQGEKTTDFITVVINQETKPYLFVVVAFLSHFRIVLQQHIF